MSENGEGTDLRVRLLERDMVDLKQVVSAISESIGRLVLIEERHQETKEAFTRAFASIDAIDGRLDKIEQKMPMLEETRGWIVKGVIGTVAIVFVAVVGLVVHLT